MRREGLTRREFLEGTSASLVAASFVPLAISGTPAALAKRSWGAGLSEGFPIFPKPQEMELSQGHFTLEAKTALLLPSSPAESDRHLARFLIEELSDRYDLQLATQQGEKLLASGRFILMGSIQNPLVRAHCAQRNLEVSAKSPGPEGYILQVDEKAVLIAGSDGRGAFYGFQSLRQLIEKGGQGLQIRAARVRDWPDKPFRGMKLYLPGRNNIPFFKRFVRDFLAQYKVNKLMVEMNACMRFDRHPELNAGWVEFARDTNWSRRNYPSGVPHDMEQNSSHHDTADGRVLEKSEVADLVRWVQDCHIEVLPEIPSFTHSFYLLTRHRDLAQVPGEKWPDTYCACNPKSYELLFDVMDEYLEVMRPKMVHAGHDEWFAPYGLGECCKGKDPGEVYGRDLKTIHAYLANKGIQMAIWGDYLLEGVRGKGLQKRTAPDGFSYFSPGGMTPEQVKSLVPKDILIFNWFWSEEEKGEVQEAQLDDFGFHQVYGNMEPDIRNYTERSKRSTIIGGAPSSWAASTEFNLGKDLLYSVLGCSGMLWSKQVLEGSELSALTQARMPEIRRRLRGVTPPSQAGDPVAPLDISASFNMPQRESNFDIDLSGMRKGRIAAGRQVFELNGAESAAGKAAVAVGTEGRGPNPLPREVDGIKVGVDATSLLFLHACAKPATNKEAYRLIWDFDDSADLLGWYEVVYEDGLPEVIPIRYGVNILEWNWGKQPAGRYCYGADLVACGAEEQNPITFFAFEWTSPRLGKMIQEVRMKGSKGFRGAVPGFENAFGEVIPNNAIILKAISYVKKRD
jgi:glycosyl hydrolase family 20